MDKLKLILILTIIILLVLGGYVLNDKVVKPYYENQGAIIMRNQIAITQTQTGDILLVKDNNLTSLNINDICGGSR